MSKLQVNFCFCGFFEEWFLLSCRPENALMNITRWGGVNVDDLDPHSRSALLAPAPLTTSTSSMPKLDLYTHH